MGNKIRGFIHTDIEMITRERIRRVTKFLANILTKLSFTSAVDNLKEPSDHINSRHPKFCTPGNT